MKRISIIALAAVALLGLTLYLPSSLHGKSTPKAKAPAISPQAETYLRGMVDYVAGLKQAWLHAEITREIILPSGQRLDMLQGYDAWISRPDRLRLDVMRVNRDRQIFYDGKTLTIYSPTKKLYATFDAPPTTKELRAMAVRDYGLTFPLADIIAPESYEALVSDVTSGRYVGASYVNGTYTHQLAFRQKDLDWQIWVQDGDKPWPCRLVITDRAVKGEPQFIANLTKWNVTPTFTDDIFIFTPPEGAQKTRFLKRPKGQ